MKPEHAGPCIAQNLQGFPADWQEYIYRRERNWVPGINVAPMRGHVKPAADKIYWQTNGLVDKK